jgi:predicted CXXCH cytochrome family protein
MTAYVLWIAIAAGPVGVSSDLTYVNTWTTGGLSYPARIAPAPGGGIYVTDPPMKQVVRFDAAGAVVGTYAVSQGPVGIAVHADGRVFVSREDGVIGVYDAALAPLVPPGTVNPAPFTLSGPNDLAMHLTDNELYAVDSGEHRVLVFTERRCSGTTVPCGSDDDCVDPDTCTDIAVNTWALLRSWGMAGVGLGQFAAPQAIAVDAIADHVIVTDTDNFRVQVFDTTGILLFRFGYRTLYLPTTDVAWVARPEGVAVDSCGNIYLADALMGTVRVFSKAGGELDALHAPAIGYGIAAGQLRVPCDIAIDSSGSMYVANTNNGTVEVFDVTCTVSATAAASDGARDASAKQRIVHPRHPGDPRLMGSALARIQAPDNPADIVAWINASEYREEFDLNGDQVVNMTDLEIAVEQFGAGTVDDFLTATADGGDPDHPALNPPHVLDLPNRCGRCHSMDGAPGGMLAPSGQENLCQSCHSAGKIAGEKWIGPASRENSHPWGLPASNADPGPVPGSQVALHLDNGNVRCGTCHNPHESNQGTCQIGGVAPPTPASHIGRCAGGPFEGKLCQSNDQCDNGYLRTGGDKIELCGECHVQYDEWLHAGHSDHDAVPFSRNWAPSPTGSARCRRCHSGDGYVDFSNGVPWTLGERRGTHRVHDCLVCHSTHGKSQDETLLRIYDDVAIFETTGNPAGTTLTGLKESATCIACHNGRDPVTDTGLTPHYLLGGAMLLGFNGVTTFRNVAYSVDHSVHEQRLRAGTLGCATCHMADGPAPGEPGAGKVGGHTFNIKWNESGGFFCTGGIDAGQTCTVDADCDDLVEGDGLGACDPADPDYGFENVANTCAVCHTGLTTFNLIAGGDYDGDGVVEGVQDETRGLMGIVVDAIEATGAQQIVDAEGHPTFPYWRVAQCVLGPTPGATCTSNSACGTGGTCVTVINPAADRPVVEDAIWNWQFVYNSRDYGVKNTGYAIGLLQIAYKGVTNQAVPNAAYRYSPAP